MAALFLRSILRGRNPMTQTIPAKKNFFNQNVDLMNGPIFKSLS